MKFLSLFLFIFCVANVQAAPFDLRAGVAEADADLDRAEADVLGNWKLDMEPEVDINGEKVKFKIWLKIEANKIITKNVCVYPGGNEIPVTAEAAIKINDASKEIEILADASNEVEINGKSCQVAIASGKGEYHVDGDKLTLTHMGQQITLKRE